MVFRDASGGKNATFSFLIPPGPTKFPVRPRNIFGEPKEKQGRPTASTMGPMEFAKNAFIYAENIFRQYAF